MSRLYSLACIGQDVEVLHVIHMGKCSAVPVLRITLGVQQAAEVQCVRLASCLLRLHLDEDGSADDFVE